MSDLTYEAIKAVYDDLMKSAPPRQPSVLDMLYKPSFAGMNVYVEPEVPKLQLRDIKLRDGTPLVSKEFRDEYNAWLAARFGYREGLCKNRVLLLGNYGMMVSKPNYALLMSMVT